MNPDHIIQIFRRVLNTPGGECELRLLRTRRRFAAGHPGAQRDRTAFRDGVVVRGLRRRSLAGRVVRQSCRGSAMNGEACALSSSVRAWPD